MEQIFALIYGMSLCREGASKGDYYLISHSYTTDAGV